MIVKRNDVQLISMITRQEQIWIMRASSKKRIEIGKNYGISAISRMPQIKHI